MLSFISKLSRCLKVLITNCFENIAGNEDNLATFSFLLQHCLHVWKQGLSFEFPWGPGVFLLYRIGPLPFSMACRKRRLKSETNGCFPRNS